MATSFIALALCFLSPCNIGAGNVMNCLKSFVGVLTPSISNKGSLMTSERFPPENGGNANRFLGKYLKGLVVLYFRAQKGSGRRPEAEALRLMSLCDLLQQSCSSEASRLDFCSRVQLRRLVLKVTLIKPESAFSVHFLFFCAFRVCFHPHDRKRVPLRFSAMGGKRLRVS